MTTITFSTNSAADRVSRNNNEIEFDFLFDIALENSLHLLACLSVAHDQFPLKNAHVIASICSLSQYDEWWLYRRWKNSFNNEWVSDADEKSKWLQVGRQEDLPYEELTIRRQ